MSIWSSYYPIGEDGGQEVLAYFESHRYPDNSRGWAILSVAAIPFWCVPGHFEDDRPGWSDQDNAVGPWLRLSIDLTDPESADAGVAVLDEAAVRQLHAQLGEWLALPKVHPR